MTSEEIIQRLLDQKKITTKEALIILKDLAKIGITQLENIIFPDVKPKIPYSNQTVVMYGVQTSPSTHNDEIFSYPESISIEGKSI